MKRLLIILTAVVLAACGQKVTSAYHMEWAGKVCANNGGIHYIEKAWLGPEFESCGYKCSRQSGRTKYQANVLCENGAIFVMDEAK